MSKMRFRKAVLGLLLFLFGWNLFGQSFHSDLKDPALLKRFRHISESVMCVCGCNLVLSTCNMAVCEAWAMRAAIDGLILDGKSDEFIINGFVNGFGDLVDTHPAFKMVQPGGKFISAAAGFRSGFGPNVKAVTDIYRSEIVMGVIFLLLLGAALLFIRSRFRNIPKEASPKATGTDKEKEDLYKKLYD